MTFTPGYLATVARRVGVPNEWVEDAVGDMTLALWLCPKPTMLVVRNAAIDAARRYNTSRSGHPRRADKWLSELTHDVGGTHEFDAPVALSEVCRRLRGRHGTALLLWACGWKLWEIGRMFGVSERRAGQLVQQARMQVA